MKKYFTAVGISILATAMIGCSSYSKDDYLDDFAGFISSIESEYQSYSDDDWSEKDVDFQLYASEYYELFKDELTSDDLRIIGKLKAKYQTIKVKNNAARMMDKVEEGLNQLEGIIEGVIETISNP